MKAQPKGDDPQRRSHQGKHEWATRSRAREGALVTLGPRALEQQLPTVPQLRAVHLAIGHGAEPGVELVELALFSPAVYTIAEVA
ncbi:MAG: hypothetical protein RLZZ450_3055 [Pseudomonadota bacterium]